VSRFNKALLIGAAAGIIDVVPMIAMGLNWYAITSAFIQWIVLGIVIPHIHIGLHGWVRGFIVAELCVLPVMIIVSMNGIPGIIPIIISTAVLGSGIGYFSDKYPGKPGLS
jgi:hypothetical protein